jgi:carbon-monoxide dehydrogenase medium subunit
VKAPPFEYHAAKSVDDALDRLAALGDEAKLLAGGQSLVPMTSFRLVRPSALVDIGRLHELNYLDTAGDGLRIGALTRHRTLEYATDAALSGYGVLRGAAKLVGHVPIRARGTFGGSLAHADAASEWCMLALALRAEVVLRRTTGQRVVAADDFFVGLFETVLAADEMLVEVRLPPAAGRYAMVEFARRHGDYAIVAAAAALDLPTGPRIVVGGVDEVPVRVKEAERIVAESGASPAGIAEAAAAAAREVQPSSDVHGSAGYRRKLTTVMVRRALERALAGGAPAGVPG